MAPDPLLARLQELANNFTCRYWRCVAVVSPREHEEKAKADYEYNSSVTAAVRLEQAQGKYAVIFHGPQAPDWRGGLPGSRPVEAIAAFSSEATNLSDDQIRLYFIGVILERECHEVLESAQVTGIPNTPIIDPHTQQQDLYDMLTWVRDWMVNHVNPSD